MQWSKHLFQKINTDDSERLLPETDYINLENALIGQNEFGKNFEFQNIPSSQLLFYYTSSENTIGTVTNDARKRLIWFEYDDDKNYDSIRCYDIESNTNYLILIGSQVQNNLNFSKDYRIDRNAKVLGDLLFWTDDLNEPRCINMERGIKLNQPSYVTTITPYLAPIPATSITIIVRPPIYRLQVTKTTDNVFKANFIANNSYQFYYRYWYKDYPYSVLSTFSQLVPYNYATETYNAINVKMPYTENIPDEVQQIDFCFRYGNEGKSFIVRSWNKDNPYDLIAMQSHNAGTVQLGFVFYDNIAGVNIDDITANTAFHDVALLAKTLELARDRLFMANVLKGYNTPSTTSLMVSLGQYNTGGGGTYVAQWKYFYLTAVQNGGSGTTTVQFFYAYNSTLATTSYYYLAYQSATPPASVNASDADQAWQTESQLAAAVQRNTSPPSGYHWQTPGFTFFTTGSTTNLIFAVNLNGLQFFKSSSIVQTSIAFYDRYRRKTGVVNYPVQITIPDRTATQTIFATTVNWTLNNTNALAEIPDWAYYYQIQVTKNETTRFFVQIFANDSAYVLKNQDGTYDYSPTTYSGNVTYAIGISLTSLTNKGLGYTFTEGDLIRIYFTDGTNVVLPVLGQDGNYVLVKAQDIGTLGTGTGFLIELFTPYKPSTNEPFYETYDMIPVLNPTTNSRQYSTTSGSINGDCYAIERDKGTSGTELYFCEAMSPNDKVWQSWETDRGWINFFDTIGQQLKENNIDWSDTYITGTKTNGLNNFEPLNTKAVGSSSGSVQKLQLTNKQQEDGTVMLVITDTDSLSAYLQEVQLYKASSVEGLITTDDIIGTINPHQNGQGTINPESVVEYNGTVWWINVLKGIVAQYSNNGVDNISDIKVRRFFDRWCKRYVSLGKSGVQALCGFSHIAACVDLTNGLYMLVLPQTEVNSVVDGIPVGFAQPLPSYDSLPSYASSIQNRFDFYDGQPKTVCFNYNENKWVGAFQWLPEAIEFFGNKLFAFKTGYLWLMNESTTSWNTIFGVQYPQRICFTTNLPPSEVKNILNIALESNQIPNFTVLYATYPNEQITDLTQDDYNNTEGIQYAQFLRDRISPNNVGTADEKLYTGDPILTAVGYVMIEFMNFNEPLKFNFSNIGFELSRGQAAIIK